MDLEDKFKERMQKQLSGEWQAFQQFLQETPPISIRLNPLKKIDFQGEKYPGVRKVSISRKTKKFIYGMRGVIISKKPHPCLLNTF